MLNDTIHVNSHKKKLFQLTIILQFSLVWLLQSSLTVSFLESKWKDKFFFYKGFKWKDKFDVRLS